MRKIEVFAMRDSFVTKETESSDQVFNGCTIIKYKLTLRKGFLKGNFFQLNVKYTQQQGAYNFRTLPELHHRFQP